MPMDLRHWSRRRSSTSPKRPQMRSITQSRNTSAIATKASRNPAVFLAAMFMQRRPFYPEPVGEGQAGVFFNVSGHRPPRRDALAIKRDLAMTTSDPTTQTLEHLGAKTPEAVAEKFAAMRQQFDREATGSSDRENLQAFVLRWTGRKAGVLTQITNNWLKTAPLELKPAVGQELNKLKAHVESVIAERQLAIEAASEQTASARDKIDLSLPGIERAYGTRHLIRQTFEELQQIFIAIGFSVVQGPEIETPYYNFEALNIPEHHPARDNMDTFYIEGARNSHLLRTHTSPMQIRTMEKEKPPVRIVVPGKVYRRDNPDATHGYMFHQIEGLAVDTDITFCDFKGT